jgi:gag-polypeptide of LTR copia-type
MSTDDKTPAFVLLNDTNFGQWSIRMKAHLIWNELWNMVVCESATEGKTDAEVGRIGRRKGQRRKLRMPMLRLFSELRTCNLHTSAAMTTVWDTLSQVHRAHGLATRLALRRQFLTSVKGAEEIMSAWVGRMKLMSHRLEDIGVDISDKDTILALMMGLNKLYDSFIISLDTTPPEQLTLEHVISRMLNEEVLCNNVEIQEVAVKGKGGGMHGEVRVKKEENVAMVAMQRDGPTTCWRCGKTGHVKAFCKEKPIRGPGSDEANVAFAVIGIDSSDEYLTQISDLDGED